MSEDNFERYGRPVALVLVFCILSTLIAIRSVVRGLRCIGLLPAKAYFDA